MTTRRFSHWGAGARRVTWLPSHTAWVRVGKEPRSGLGHFKHRPLDPSALQAVVGDSELHTFHYRIQPERVRVVEVGGDLQLESVKIF